jgi:hypothetical protein
LNNLDTAYVIGRQNPCYKKLGCKGYNQYEHICRQQMEKSFLIYVGEDIFYVGAFRHAAMVD